MTGSGRSHPTIVEIRLADEATIRSLLEGARTLGPFEVIEGAAPPEPLLDLALAGLARRTAAIWCAPWLFVDAEARLVVGSAAFKGPPASGRVEIGYGVAESCWGKGYATQGVRAVLAEAFRNPAVTEIYAESSVDNVASRRVLEKSGFRKIGQRDCPEDGLMDQWILSRAAG